MTDPQSTHHRPSRMLGPNNSEAPRPLTRAEMMEAKKQVDRGWIAFCAKRGLASKTLGWKTIYSGKS